MERIHKYPRTRHLEGSRVQPGDEDLEAAPFSDVAGRWLVVEEKLDGANSGIGFSSSGALQLQSRGHYLRGGARERHFDLFKSWAQSHAGTFRELLGKRYLMYGEWLYAKHTIYYNALPHYFIEFDILDKTAGRFLSSERRRALLANLPFISSATILSQGPLRQLDELRALVTTSTHIRGAHLAELRRQAERLGLDPARALRETDPSKRMEGLYLKIEQGGEVRERYKFIRADFLTTVTQSQSHWLNRPIIPNKLVDGVDIFKGS